MKNLVFFFNCFLSKFLDLQKKNYIHFFFFLSLAIFSLRDFHGLWPSLFRLCTMTILLIYDIQVHSLRAQVTHALVASRASRRNIFLYFFRIAANVTFYFFLSLPPPPFLRLSEESYLIVISNHDSICTVAKESPRRLFRPYVRFFLTFLWLSRHLASLNQQQLSSPIVNV